MMWLVASALVVAIAAAAWVVGDYRAWRALGPGGLPPTWAGWWRTTRWRMMARDPLALEPLRAHMGGPEDRKALAELVARIGDRPRIAPHPVPHRQLDQHAPEPVKALLRAAFDARVALDPERLVYARSHFEKHNDAVTLRPDHVCCADARATHGEIGHIHPWDGSMHLILSPSDAATVVERGWGQRHGLAGVTLGLPLTYTLIYAPRDDHEVDVDGRILDAAIAYMGAVPDGRKEKSTRSDT